MTDGYDFWMLLNLPFLIKDKLKHGIFMQIEMHVFNILKW